MRPLLGFAFLALVGCHQSKPLTPLRSASEIEEDYAARARAIRAEAQSHIWWPVCETPPKPGAGCGLFADTITQESVRELQRTRCLEDGPMSDRCVDLVLNDFHATLRRRYNRADVAAVKVACDRSCKTLSDEELQYIEAHNSVVANEARAKIRELTEAYDRDQSTTATARATRQRLAAEQRQGFAMASNVVSTSYESTGPVAGCRSDRDCGIGKACMAQGNGPAACVRVVGASVDGLAGCCAGHGSAASCDASGRVRCHDNFVSVCRCAQ